MNNRFIAGASVLLVAGGVAGCSDPKPVARPAGTLPAGTAEVSINGAGQGRTTAVSCSTTGQYTSLTTGDDQAGATASIQNGDALTVQFVEISNVGGFTGSYWAELGPPAKVELTGGTYSMTGTAQGFNADNPSARITEPFSIKVAC